VVSEESSKRVAYYTALVDAWISTRMERDRTLLTLAVGGIGLLATLLTTVGPTSIAELALYGFAAVSFLVSALAAIKIFTKNGHYLEDVIQKGTKGDDPQLKVLDRLVLWSFISGVVLTMSIAASSGYRRMQENRSMPNQDTQTTGAGGIEHKSLTGVGNLAPGGGTPAAGSQGSGSQSGTPAGSGSGNASPGKK